MGRKAWRERAFDTAKDLQACFSDQRVYRFLSQEERDWCRLLAERMWDIAHNRVEGPVDSPDFWEETEELSWEKVR